MENTLEQKLKKMSSDTLFKYIKDNLTEEGNDRVLLYRNDKDLWNDFESPAEAVEFRNTLMCNSQGAFDEYNNGEYIIINCVTCDSYCNDDLYYLITECTDLINYLK